MKSLISKFVGAIFIFSLATGCASSLTAPNMDQPQQKTVQQNNNNNKQHPTNLRGGDGLDPQIIVANPG